MSGEKDLSKLLQNMTPQLHDGDYVFCVVDDLVAVDMALVISVFKEQEGYTLILQREYADLWQLAYTLVLSWITLTVHSSLEAVGLTAAFSKALSENGIGCNVVAAYYHDHIFVGASDALRAMEVLKGLRDATSF